MINIKENTVLVPYWMTWQRWGCKNLEYFEKFIKGRWLEIQSEYKPVARWATAAETTHQLHEQALADTPGRRIFTLIDAIGEPWNLPEIDLIQDKKEAERMSWPWLKDPIREKGYDAVAAEIEQDIAFRSEPKEKLRARLMGAIYNAELLGVLSGMDVKNWSRRLNTDTIDELEAGLKELQGLMEGVEK